MNTNYIIIIFFFYASVWDGQVHHNNVFNFKDLREQALNYQENDPKGLSVTQKYINKAKKNNNTYELIHGYKMGIRFSSYPEMKIKYADSSIAAALKSRDSVLIASSYMSKGSIYYFNYRDYQEALKQFEKAYVCILHEDEPYLLHKIEYHIAQINLYLGYNQKALPLLYKCLSYFEKSAEHEPNATLRGNYTKGYYNSLHLAAVANLHLNCNAKADSLIQDGLLKTNGQADYLLERSYFLKCKGLQEMTNQHYDLALQAFQESIPILVKADDFAWLAVVYYNTGKALSYTSGNEAAISFYKKVDSIYTVKKFIWPQLRENYLELIRYFKSHRDIQKELFYTRQLSKVDSSLYRNFQCIAPEVFKAWDFTAHTPHPSGLNSNFLNITVLIAALVYIWTINYRKTKKSLPNKASHKKYTSAPSIPSEKILMDLKNFEKSQGFLQKKLTLDKLARDLGTNRTYLAQSIHQHYNMNFTKYLNHLRIRYIVDAIDNKPHYREYKIQTLADECGMASRQNFSQIFKEFTNKTPIDYINEMKKIHKDL